MPLQELCPWHAFVAVAQADWPLQAFTPSHFTFASAASTVASGATLNSKAAAVATAAPPDLRMTDI